MYMILDLVNCFAGAMHVFWSACACVYVHGILCKPVYHSATIKEACHLVMFENFCYGSSACFVPPEGVSTCSYVQMWSCLFTILRRRRVLWSLSAAPMAYLGGCARTSSSRCSMTSITSLRLSMKELTATRSMRLVVAR